jgi:two-component system, NarL family, nitrate/nitrite response regulator NarL
MALRLLIADDNEGFLKSARSALEREGIDVVGTATTAAEAIGRVEELSPEVVLVDISFGEDSGFELARRLAELINQTLRILLISTHAEEDFAELIDASPAVGFMSKYGLSARGIRELLAAEGG